MNRITAQELTRIVADASRKTDQSVKEVLNSCDSEIFNQYRRLAGRIMGFMFTEILAPLWTEHGDLAPDWFRDRDANASTHRKPVIDRTLRDQLLALMDEISSDMSAAVQLADGDSDQESASKIRAGAHEIKVYVDAVRHYLRSLETSDESSSSES